MQLNFSAAFHRASKDHNAGRTRPIPGNDALWPPEWTTTYYKSYPRFRKIPLEKTDLTSDLFECIGKRRSVRSFPSEPVSKTHLSTLLQHACGIVERYADKNPRRAYPSGGARYPIEIYTLVFAEKGEISPGLYHYNVQDHALDVLWERPFSADEIGTLFTYKWAQGASCAIVMTAVFQRTQMKYAERGYRYVLLEAGHIGQNICLVANAVGLACCPIVGTYDTPLERLIDIDGVTESVVYALALGYPHDGSPPQASR